MNPFYFGPGERPLFGVFTHGKQGAPGHESSGAVLLCYPVGSEYMRAHRAFRQLNALLNRTGFDVLRFDYSCTGDSGGDSADASVTNWLDDIDWAIDELQANAMADAVTVCGLRMGAALAAMACAGREDVDHVVLWDPIVSGQEYLDRRLGVPRPESVIGVEGFPVTPSLQRELDEIDLTRPLPAFQGMKITVMASSDTSSYREVVAAQKSAGAEVALEVVPSQGDWAVADPFGDALIPQQIIQAIVERLRAQPTS